jgi:hypothetical protein
LRGKKKKSDFAPERNKADDDKLSLTGMFMSYPNRRKEMMITLLFGSKSISSS